MRPLSTGDQICSNMHCNYLLVSMGSPLYDKRPQGDEAHLTYDKMPPKQAMDRSPFLGNVISFGPSCKDWPRVNHVGPVYDPCQKCQ